MWNGVLGRWKKIDNGQRMGMEAVLGNVMHPIVPRPQFVDSLRKGLMDYNLIDEGGERSINQQDILIILAGFFSAALLLSIGIRILMTFIGAIGIIHYQRQRAHQKIGSP
jgi:hypothetical protein